MSTDETRKVVRVAELGQLLKRSVEDLTHGFWVEGELGRVTQPASGHLYFSLKDEKKDALIDGVMYRREASRFARYLQEGALVQLRGRASFYPPRGRLQWIADAARPAGTGAILEALARLKSKLLAEGIFDEDRKQLLPQEPQVVGVVTSRTGAAFHDICSVAARRSPVKIILSHAQVQGTDAPNSILAALHRLEQHPDVDVIILGRGGGSAEDLMAFNDEAVVRAIAECPLPIVSAVGHETDTSLSDFAADQRAATPSQAAELVVPDSRTKQISLQNERDKLRAALELHLAQARNRLFRERNKLTDPRFMLVDYQQSLDSLRMSLKDSLQLQIQRRYLESQKCERRLHARHPRAVLYQAKSKLAPLDAQLRNAMKQRLTAEKEALHHLGKSLSLLSPLSGLGRGYALATSDQGTALLDSDDLSPEQLVRVRLKKGAFSAKVVEVESSQSSCHDLDSNKTLT